MKHVIYDYETLSTDVVSVPVVSLATLTFDPKRFTTNPYTFPELVKACEEYKFDVQEQIEKFGRKVCKDTLEWWSNVPKEIRDKQLKPSKDDISVTKLPEIFAELTDKKTTIYTRGNTFDPVITDVYLRQMGVTHPYSWWLVRDTRSIISGMTYGADVSLSFIPEGLEDKFEAHNPTHDIAMDVMRIQYLAQLLGE